MILDGMTLDEDGQQLADDYETEDQSELAYYAAWMTIENEQLREALNMYQNGYQGSCLACEPVGEKNQRLLAEIEQLNASVDRRAQDAREEERDRIAHLFDNLYPDWAWTIRAMGGVKYNEQH